MMRGLNVGELILIRVVNGNGPLFRGATAAIRIEQRAARSLLSKPEKICAASLDQRLATTSGFQMISGWLSDRSFIAKSVKRWNPIRTDPEKPATMSRPIQWTLRTKSASRLSPNVTRVSPMINAWPTGVTPPTIQVIAHPFFTKLSSTFLVPAFSKSMVSLLPSIWMTSPYPNLRWKTRSPRA